MLRGDESIVGVTSCYNIKLHIVVIGYRKKGESILVIFEDTGRPYDQRTVYSIVIDSYYDGKGKNLINKTDEYLRHFKVGKNLSMLVWTHPHLDHSKGLKRIISKYTTAKTKIISAPHFFNKPDDIIKVTGKENIDAVKEIFESFRFKSDNIGRPSVMSQISYLLDAIKFKGMDGTLMSIELDAVAPNTSILDGYKFDGIRDKNPNEVSISFILNIEDSYFLFAGDTPDNHLAHISSKNLSNCRFVKIPHHASLTSRSLTSLLDAKVLETACTTRFRAGRSNLPDKNVLGEYKKLTPYVFCTGDGNNESEKYGIIEYEYVFHKDNPFDININLYGNAFLCE